MRKQTYWRFLVAALVTSCLWGQSAMVHAEDNLPVGYRRVAYIESTGNQYIDTTVKLKTTTRLTAEMALPPVIAASTSQFSAWSGTSGANSGPVFGWCMKQENAELSLRVAAASGWTASSKAISRSSERHTVDIRSGLQMIDNEQVGSTAFTADGTYSLYLFALHEGSSAKYHQSLRLYGCRIYDGETLVRDFVPCANGDSATLYDLVSGQLFPVSGEGAFKFAERLPSGARPADYIESTGTQYIVLTETMNVNVREVCEFSIAGDAQGGGWWGVARTNPNASFLWRVEGSKAKAYVGSSWGENAERAIDASKARHVIDLASGSQKIDGEEFGTLTLPTDVPTDERLPLFVTKENGVCKYPVNIRLYGCRVYRGSVLVHDLVPYDDGTSGYLYDKVSGGAFGNSGTGEFRFPKRDVELARYIESDGTQFVDTTAKLKTTTRLTAEMSIPPAIAASSSEISGWSGTSSANSGPVFGWCMKEENSALYLKVAAASGWTANSKTISRSSEKHTVDIRSGLQMIDNEAAGSTEFTANGSYSLYLFAMHEGSSAKYHQSLRLYGCRIYDGETLVRDLTPARLDGVFGLWDLANPSEFYVSSVGNPFGGRVSAAKGVIIIFK